MTQLVPTTVENRARQSDISVDEAREELEKKNYHFVQWQKRSMSDFRRLMGQNTLAAQLLVLFAEKMDKKNAIMISNDTIGLIMGVSRASITRAIRVLKNENWIQIVKISSANAYVINHKVFWQTAGNLKYASFSAQIIASADEQDQKDLADKARLKQLPSMVHMPFSCPRIEGV